jgi:hypothetical protein
MLAELAHLLESVTPSADRAAYWEAILEGNVLGKRTGRNRLLSAKHLRELYGLDPTLPIFRALRTLWSTDPNAQPLLAFLCAYARDPLLRGSAPSVVGKAAGEAISAEEIASAVASQAPNRFAPVTLSAISRNARSSWTQSGHLSGRVKKVRTRAVATPVNTAYALFLARLEGYRDQRLFETDWARLLDRPRDQVVELAKAAGRRGIIDYKSVGEIVEVRFPGWLTPEEEELLREQG